MRSTHYFNLPYLEKGDLLYQSDETQRWGTVDGLTYVVGWTFNSGVIEDGWTITSPSNGNISISAGEGFVDGVYVRTLTPTAIALPSVATPTRMYVYCGRDDTYSDVHTFLCSFVVDTDDTKSALQIFLGSIDVAANGTVSNIDVSSRDVSEFAYQVKKDAKAALVAHRHRDYEGSDPLSPEKINLATNADDSTYDEVYGVLPITSLASVHVDSIDGELSLTDLPPFSHIGRYREIFKPKFIGCFTLPDGDQLTYKRYIPSTKWDSPDHTCFVYIQKAIDTEPVFVTTPVLIESDPTLGNVIVFTDRLATGYTPDHDLATDQVFIVTDLKTVYPTKVSSINGRWFQPSDYSDTSYINVYVNDIVKTGWTVNKYDDIEGVYESITLANPIVATDEVRVTLRGMNVSGVGRVDHKDFDDEISRYNAFGDITEANTSTGNLMTLMEGTHNLVSDTNENWHQSVTANLPGDWMEVIDDDASSIHPYNVGYHAHPSNPVGAGNGYVSLHDGFRHAQTFKAIYSNVSRLNLWLSKIGTPELVDPDVTLEVSIYDVDPATGLPTTLLVAGSTLVIATTTITAMVEGAKKITLDFVDLIQVERGKQYAIVVQQPGGTDIDNAIRWHATLDGRYLYGDAYTKDGSWALRDAFTDMSFRAYAFAEGIITPGNAGCGNGTFNLSVSDGPLYQTFNFPASKFWYASVSLSKQAGTSGNIQFSIYAVDVNGIPTGSALATSTTVIDSTTLEATAKCYNFFFGTSTDVDEPEKALALSPGNYALCLDSTATSVNWHGTMNDNYANGAAFKTTAGTIVSAGSGYDFFFSPRTTTTVDTPDGGGTGKPAKPVSLPCSSSYTATLINTTKITDIWLSRVGNGTGYAVVAEIYESPVDDVPYGGVDWQDYDPIGREFVTAASNIPVNAVKPFSVNFTEEVLTTIGDKFCLVLRAVDTTGISDSQNYVQWWTSDTDYTGGVGRSWSGTWDTLVDADPTESPAVDEFTDFTFHVFGLEGVTTITETTVEDFDFGETGGTGVTVEVNPVISIILDNSGSNSDIGGTDTGYLRYDALTTTTTGLIDVILTAYPTAVFDVMAFRNYIDPSKLGDTTTVTQALMDDGSNGIQYAYFGLGVDINGDPVVSSNPVDVKAALNRLKALKSEGSTPLMHAIQLAGERIHKMVEPGATYAGRKGVVICLSDGEATDLDANILDKIKADYVYYKPEGSSDVYPPIKFYGIGYGNEGSSSIARQVAVFAEIASATKGGFFTTGALEDSTVLATILTAIAGDKTWKDKTTTAMKVFTDVVKLSQLTVNGIVPAGTKALVDIYLFSGTGSLEVSDGNIRVTGSVIGNGPYYKDIPLNTTITLLPAVDVLQIGYVLHLTAGSSPTVSSSSIVVSAIHKEYVYTNPIRALTPVHQIKVNFPDNNVSSDARWDFSVFNGESTYLEMYEPIRNNFTEILPLRANEPLVPDSTNRVFTAKAPWSGEFKTILVKDNGYVNETEYIAKPGEGMIYFTLAQTGTITMTLWPIKQWFRVAAEISYTLGEPPIDTNLSIMWTQRPKGL